MNPGAYTGPWPIRDHRTLADFPPVPEPRTAAGEVLPPVFTGNLPRFDPRPESAPPASWSARLGTALALYALLHFGTAAFWPVIAALNW